MWKPFAHESDEKSGRPGKEQDGQTKSAGQHQSTQPGFALSHGESGNTGSDKQINEPE